MSQDKTGSNQSAKPTKAAKLPEPDPRSMQVVLKKGLWPEKVKPGSRADK